MSDPMRWDYAMVAASGVPDLRTAAPADSDGPGDAWSPEQFLMAAVESCFLFTLRAVARASKVECTAAGDLAADAAPLTVLLSPVSAAAHWPQKSNPGGIFERSKRGRRGRARLDTFRRTSCRLDYQIRTSGSASAAPHFHGPMRSIARTRDKENRRSKDSNGELRSCEPCVPN